MRRQLAAALLGAALLTGGAQAVAEPPAARYVADEADVLSKMCIRDRVGCLTYYLLYFSKSLFYDNMLVGGLPFAAAALLLPLKIPASLFNAAAAIAAAPPLCLAIRAALRREMCIRDSPAAGPGKLPEMGGRAGGSRPPCPAAPARRTAPVNP